MRSQNPRSLSEATRTMLTAGFGGRKSTVKRGRGFDAPSSNLLNRFLICGKQQTLWDCCLVLDECCCDSKRRREVFCQRLLQPLSLSASTSKMNLVLRTSYSMYMTLFAYA